MISMKFDWHKRGFVGAKELYREHAIAYPNHSSKTCGGSEAFISAIILINVGKN